jgi:hypothetical protein
MKKIFLPVILLFVVATAFGQKVTPVKDQSLVTLLNNVETFTVASDDNAAVRVYKVSNPSGSAHMPGTDEVSHRFLIAVSTIDDAPEEYLYNVGDFLAPKVLGLTKAGKGAFALSIEYGVYNMRKKVQLDITLKKVTLVSKG